MDPCVVIGRPFRAPLNEAAETQGVALGWYRPRLRCLRSRQVFFIAVVSLAVIVGLTGCSRRDDPYLQGYVEGEYVYIAPPINGIVQTLDVAQGDRVASGTLLFTMNSVKETAAVAEAQMKLKQGESLLEDARLGQRPTELKTIEAQLQQALAAHTLSSRIHERQKKLYAEGMLAAEELDRARSDAEQKQQAITAIEAQLATARQGSRMNQVAAAEANVQSLRAALEQSQWNLDQTSQTAPQSALVFDTFFRPGEVVQAGRAVVSLLPPENVRVRAFLDEAVISQVQIGTTATIKLDGIAERIPGHVTFISPQAEFTPPVIYSREMRQKLSFMIELSFSPDVAAKLHPGQPVEVQIPGLFP